jgi:CHASE3 domain sensor protein
VRTKGLIVVAVPLVALLSITSANLALQQVESNERAVSVNARNLDDDAAQVLADAVNGETGIRGYVATGDQTFLDPYLLMLTRIAAERKALRQAAIVAGVGRQQQTVDATTGQELVELAQLSSAVRNGSSPANLIPALLNGKTTMDVLRREVAELVVGPTVLVTVEHNKLTALQARIELFDIAGLVLGLLAGLAGIALFTSGIVGRVGMNAENARRLGEGLPLQPTYLAADEIGRVCESHLRAEALLARRTAELTAARDEAMRATQAKNSFLSSTSHELRTPLNAILVRAPRRRTDRGRGHRHRAAPGQSPHQGHERPADRVERPWSGSGLHRQPHQGPGPDPRPQAQPRASVTRGWAAGSGQNRPQRSLY